MRRGRRPLLGWMAALASALWLLHALGSGPLGVPLTSAHDLRAWIDQAPPEVLALALLRLAGLAAAWYLAACTVLLALSRWVRRPRLTAALARVTPALVRRMVSEGGRLGLAAGLLTAAPAAGVATIAGVATPTVAAASAASDTADAGHPGRPPETATMTHVPTPATDAPTATMARAAGTRTSTPEPPPSDRPTATMAPVAGTRTGTVEPPPSEQPTAPIARVPAEPAPLPAGTRAPSRGPAPAAASSTWIVEPGDSFWSIAAETLSPPRAEPSHERHIAGYWRRLVDANRSRLIDAANPDLLVPGQELVLPEPAG